MFVFSLKVNITTRITKQILYLLLNVNKNNYKVCTFTSLVTILLISLFIYLLCNITLLDYLTSMLKHCFFVFSLDSVASFACLFDYFSKCLFICQSALYLTEYLLITEISRSRNKKYVYCKLSNCKRGGSVPRWGTVEFACF